MYIIVFVTTKNKAEANKVAKKLLDDKLIACVNIVEGVNSMFWWEGKVDRVKESLLILKTKRSKLGKLIKAVKALHSYTVPEIIALPIIGGNEDYLKWINESINK